MEMASGRPTESRSRETPETAPPAVLVEADRDQAAWSAGARAGAGSGTVSGGSGGAARAAAAALAASRARHSAA
jgi:hypothetical protein